MLMPSSRHPSVLAVNGGTSDRYGPQNPYQSQAQRLCRTLGISLFLNLFRHRGRLPGEPKKVAIHRDFGKAFRCGWIHNVPISVTLVLVALNCRGYYIGSELTGAVGQDDAKFVALQFAAKLHELTIIASLSLPSFHLTSNTSS